MATSGTAARLFDGKVYSPASYPACIFINKRQRGLRISSCRVVADRVEMSPSMYFENVPDYRKQPEPVYVGMVRLQIEAVSPPLASPFARVKHGEINRSNGRKLARLVDRLEYFQGVRKVCNALNPTSESQFWSLLTNKLVSPTRVRRVERRVWWSTGPC